MHPISLVSGADHSADVDGEKTFLTEPPSRIHREDRCSRMCQTKQFLSPTDENVVSVFGSYEPFCIVLRNLLLAW